RMVLGRWADDGLIEVTPMVNDRAPEIADFTGLPLIAVRDQRSYAKRFPWVLESPERVLRLAPRTGGAVLTPGGDYLPNAEGHTPRVVVGKATLPIVPLNPPEAAASSEAASSEPASSEDASEPASSEPASSEAASSESGSSEPAPAVSPVEPA